MACIFHNMPYVFFAMYTTFDTQNMETNKAALPI